MVGKQIMSLRIDIVFKPSLYKCNVLPVCYILYRISSTPLGLGAPKTNTLLMPKRYPQEWPPLCAALRTPLNRVQSKTFRNRQHMSTRARPEGPRHMFRTVAAQKHAPLLCLYKGGGWL